MSRLVSSEDKTLDRLHDTEVGLWEPHVVVATHSGIHLEKA